jgi:hypothetical protein
MRYLDRFYLVFEDLKTATPAEVAASAARLKLTFPDGYAEYVTELGAGILSTYLRIALPRQVEEDLAEHRQFLFGDFFWEEDGPLSPVRARETVLLGGTLDGDSLVFHPNSPNDLYVLPRHQNEIHQLGPGLDAALDWLCDSGVLTRPMSLRYFEPIGERVRIERSIQLSYDVVRDALLDLRLHDHIAFEEQSEDEDFEVKIKVGDEFQEIEYEDSSIMLLIKEIGGDVLVSSGSLFRPQATDVAITHVAGCPRGKLDRLLGRLDELEFRAGKPKRRKR